MNNEITKKQLESIVKFSNKPEIKKWSEEEYTLNRIERLYKILINYGTWNGDYIEAIIPFTNETHWIKYSWHNLQKFTELFNVDLKFGISYDLNEVTNEYEFNVLISW